MTLLKSVDWDLCLELANGKPDLAKELLTMFVKDIPDAKAGLVDAFEDRNMEQLAQLAHRLHGACCYCGVPVLKQIMHDLEFAAGHGQVEECALLISQMVQEMDNICEATDNETYQELQ